jgi:hypothetical protein
MGQVLSLRYARTSRIGRPTAWAQDWRRRWLRNVGAVCEHHADRGLIACYSDARDPAMRLALQHELEARPDGVGQVLAACAKARRDFEARLTQCRRAKVAGAPMTPCAVGAQTASPAKHVNG